MQVIKYKQHATEREKRKFWFLKNYQDMNKGFFFPRLRGSCFHFYLQRPSLRAQSNDDLFDFLHWLFVPQDYFDIIDCLLAISALIILMENGKSQSWSKKTYGDRRFSANGTKNRLSKKKPFFSPKTTFHSSQKQVHIWIQPNNKNYFWGLLTGQRNVLWDTPYMMIPCIIRKKYIRLPPSPTFVIFH